MKEIKPEKAEQAQQKPEIRAPEAASQSMEDRLHRQISETEKLEAVLSVLSGKKKAEEVCRDLHVSKEGFYKWMRLAMAAMKESLKPVGRGRKSKQTPEEKSQLKSLEKANKQLEKEKKHVETLYRIAKTLIEWQEEARLQRSSKKKDDSARS